MCFCITVFMHFHVLISDKYMYSGSADQSIIKWNVESFRVVATIPGHENPVCTLAIDKIRQRLYSGSLKSIKVLVIMFGSHYSWCYSNK